MKKHNLVHSKHSSVSAAHYNLTRAEKQWLWLRSLAFPLVILTPYLLVRTDFGCFGEVSAPCVLRTQPSLIPQLIIWVAILGILLIAYIRRSAELREHRHALIKRQLRTTLVTVVLTGIAFAIIRLNSQAAGVNQVFYQIQQPNTGVAMPQPWFGLGISPSTLVYLSLAYTLGPLYAWFAFFRSNQHIEGIKKRELFQ